MRISPIILAILLTLNASVASAADFDKGVAAFEAGDYQTAFDNFLPLAEQGGASAQYNLGFMYGNGYGVPQDYAEAVRWYRMAAEQGHDSAQNNLGNIFRNGYGVPEDDAEAVRWYRMAAEQGLASAQFNLGSMYLFGKGVPKDDATSHMWLNIAGARGYEFGRDLRELIEKKMTPDAIIEAQRRARICMSSGYQNCD